MLSGCKIVNMQLGEVRLVVIEPLATRVFVEVRHKSYSHQTLSDCSSEDGRIDRAVPSDLYSS